MAAKGQRYLKIAGGFSLVLLGFPLLFMPAPGMLVILLGLAMLAAEYVWARRLLDQVRKQGARVRGALQLSRFTW